MTTPSDLPSERADLPFVGIASFLRSPVVDPDRELDADVVVLGAPPTRAPPSCPAPASVPGQSGSTLCAS